METELEIIKTIINSDKFTIFGTGSVAKRFGEQLKYCGCWDNVSHFSVSLLKDDMVLFEGKKVVEIKDVTNDSIVMIAVHNIFVDEIIDKLKKLGFKRFFWIYPHLFDLCFGIPKHRDVVLKVDEVVQRINGFYVNAIYYLAIENVLGKNKVGREVYLKFMSVFSSEKAAKKRWEDFVQKIYEYEQGNVQQNYNIKLSHNHDIVLDGSHRLMLAFYFNVSEITADMYSCDLKQYKAYAQDMAMTDNQLNKYFSHDEILLIKETDNILKAQNVDLGGE
ncbi:hypothetical protein [Paenibacillus sp. FSL K6-1558]|uniref:hypothetical protein n=1 Tax=Paenibacillus sp. FSL K6-1558 TaxID=2921473 RepID=UPI0012B8E5B1|nr:hypothetical protein [Paenibacillus xylanexedens]